jgi:hypothetical protein
MKRLLQTGPCLPLCNFEQPQPLLIRSSSSSSVLSFTVITAPAAPASAASAFPTALRYFGAIFDGSAPVPRRAFCYVNGALSVALGDLL